MSLAEPPPPRFAVDIEAPDLSPWRVGNTGVPGFTSFDSGVPGPHVLVSALMHGNEIAGAVVLDAMLRAGVAPDRGRLTLGFLNLAAFDNFDPADPTASRFVDEDMNRLWDASQLDGPRRSSELDRARAVRPLVDTADLLLDLHSMLWPSGPLTLCGPSTRGRALGVGIATPDLVIADHGHVGGRRLIDYARFTGPGHAAAVLVEAGQHWAAQSVGVTRDSVAGLLDLAGMVPAPRSEAIPKVAPQVAEVTTVVTAATGAFAFVRTFQGGDMIPERNTLIAMDGPVEVRTPHDHCLLVMPSLRPSRGHTAVRLARFV